MNYNDLTNYIDSNLIDELLNKTTCSDDLGDEKKRYHALLDEAYKSFGDGDYHFVSSPGRTEVGGNHTDHQHGHILAATLSVDNVCVCKKSDDSLIIFRDPLFNEVKVNINDLRIKKELYNTSDALIIGIAAKLKENGYKIGGFRAICNSKVLIGASISSSACFEMMIVEIFNSLFNEGKVNPVERALIGQYSENVYFGKASGLLDQLTISVGGFVSADFKEPSNPVIENFEFNFEDFGYKFFVVNTKGSHMNLSDEYSAIPYEIKEVAHELNVEYLADSTFDQLLSNMQSIRKNVKNDRAILRSIHFYEEDKRAIDEKEAIKNKDIDKLLKLMVESGRSSYMYLQNVYAASNTKSQGIAIACALSENYLDGAGAFRIQGGGFEGTIIAVVPNSMVEGYRLLLTSVFGDDCILDASIRPFGTKTII